MAYFVRDQPSHHSSPLHPPAYIPSSSSSSSSFVLVDVPLRYPLFGCLPWPATLQDQISISIALIAVSTLVMVAVTGLRSGAYDLLWRFGRQEGESNEAGSSNGSCRRRRAAHTHEPDTTSGGDWYPGLVNTGNTCFFNSVLQSLASLPSFGDHLRALHCKAEQADVPTPVLDALLDLIILLNTPSFKRRRAVRPYELTQALSKRNPQGGRGALRSLVTAHQQQDAHELLVLLLDALSQERDEVLKSLSGPSSRPEQGGLAGLLGPTLDVVRTPAAALPNPFDALVAQRTACLTCGYYDVIRNYAQEELTLNVPYSRTWGGVRLEDCLAEWAQLEGVEWRCWACTLRGNAAKVGADFQRLSVDATSSSAKKRLKELRKTQSALQDAMKEGASEEDFRTQHPNIKLAAALGTGRGPTATKQIVFSRPPDVLALHLSRSLFAGFGASKNDTRVAFGEWLDLSAVCLGDGGVESQPARGMNQLSGSDDEEDEGWTKIAGPHAATNGNGNGYSNGNGGPHPPPPPPSSPPVYRLCSVVCHYGGHSFGHYVAYRRAPTATRTPATLDTYLDGSVSDAWLRISDESVQQVTIKDVLAEGKGAVVVFYERVGSATHQEARDRSYLPGGPAGKVFANLVEGEVVRSGRRPRQVERWQIRSSTSSRAATPSATLP
ncbi:cysteine proteinase [Jaminaea rosea]|uniref:Ubiquitin carboxyl-terminal hydrolase n=1 Tax=Jaminaea rosea TaxID=1569628 RepID=A0A316V6F8_9BASI|nr:cysteine proteinase [Jaminaea rosea]PWN31025.1 cysteine proteinase [Jaminaea rosea]